MDAILNMKQTNSPLFVELEDLADYVEDGQRIGVGGLHFARLPLALIQELIHRGRRELEYVSWGGGLPLELLLAADAVRKIVFCFSSLDIFGLSPLFRRALEEQEVEIEEWTALAMIQGFHAAQQKLPSMPFQIPHGSELMERSGYAVAYEDPVDGRALGAAPALPLDVFLLHAQRADEDGNVEVQGALGLDFSALWAAETILVTVEEIVPRGTLQQKRTGAVIPRNFVTGLTAVAWGAYPSSCLPYYPTDYDALLEATANTPVELPPLKSERRAFLAQVPDLGFDQITAPALLRHASRREANAPATVDEQMAVSLARCYDNNSICAAGAVSPLAIVSYLLAKRLHAPDLLLMTMSSGFVDVAVRPMVMVLAEWLDFQSATVHCGGDDTYHWYYQPGLVTHEVVSAAQIDRFARTNNIEILRSDGSPIRLPGQGGMADVANMHRNFLLYLTRHSKRTLVPEVDYVSAARGILADEERRAAGWLPGEVKLVTDLGIFKLNRDTGLLELSAMHPGVTVEQVAEATGFPLQLADRVEETAPPTAEELQVLRSEIDPLGIRRLEFVPSRERSALIQELIDNEEAAIAELLTQPTQRMGETA